VSGQAHGNAAAPDLRPGAPPRADAAAVLLERKVRDLEAILSVTRLLAVEEDLDRLLPLMAQACSRVLQAERSSLWVVEPETGELFTKVAQGAQPIRLKPGEGVVGFVAAHNAPLCVPDAYSDRRFNPDVDRRTGYHTREILCFPLTDLEGRRVVGVLQALNKIGGQGFTPYDQELASALAAQAGVALQRAALREQAVERKRLQAELDLARTIQQSLLPKDSPRVHGLMLAGASRSAAETSGDYFDYLDLGPGHLGLVVADVSGHGLGPALIMMEARAVVRSLCAAAVSPARLLAAANALLTRDLDAGNFLTLCLGCFDLANGRFSYASAGHDPPLIYRARDDAFLDDLPSTGPVLGVIPNAEFGMSRPCSLDPGDVLVFTTDGLPESRDRQDELLGKERLKDLVRRSADSDAGRILELLLKAAADWSGPQAQRDDITVAVAKVGADWPRTKGE
jgi:phosphoserine phosphatase